MHGAYLEHASSAAATTAACATADTAAAAIATRAAELATVAASFFLEKEKLPFLEARGEHDKNTTMCR